MVSKTQYQPPRTILLSGVALVVVTLASFMFLRLGGSHQSLAGSPRLVIGPSPAAPGATLSVSGFNYSPSTGVKVYFQSPANGIVNTDTSPGGFFNVSLTLPRQISGTPHIYAVSNSETVSAIVSVIKPFLITSNIAPSQTISTLSPVSVSGGGFIANGPVKFTLHNGTSSVPAGTTVADKLGHVTFDTSSLNTLVGGAQSTLTATDLAQNTASVPLALGSFLRVTPAGAQRGTMVTVRGYRFDPNDTVTITLQGITVAIKPTPANGSFFATFPVPTSAMAGLASIVATSSTRTATFPFKVLSPLKVTPAGGPGGTIVNASGGSFTPNGPVQVTLVCPLVSCVGTPIGSYAASSNGTIYGSFTMPLGTGRGLYSLAFQDSSGAITIVSFFVTR